MNQRNRWLRKASRSVLPYAETIRMIRDWEVRTAADVELKSALSETHGLTDPRRLALITEVIRRLTGLELFDSQLSAAISILNGNIAELPTGEGKTLSAVVAAISCGLENQQVHVMTFNDYLAERDWNETREIYRFCGLDTGRVLSGMAREARRLQYGCQVVYITAREAGFDYLREFLCLRPHELLRLKFQRAIIDEADSILLDEAGMPLVLAVRTGEESAQLCEIGRAVRSLSEGSVAVQESNGVAYLTETGIREMERLLGLRELYGEENRQLLCLTNLALEARFLLKRDRDYIVREDRVQLVEDCTGRRASKHRYPNLLQGAVEEKEGVPITGQTRVLHSMTLRNFLLQYGSLSGMTGTASSAKGELMESYGLAVDLIPPHRPCVRQDHEDRVFETKGEMLDALTEETVLRHRRGQPVLIGTGSVEESERVSRLLWERGVAHQVLNAKNDREEAALIAQAGRLGAVTVSTAMAGRGVDIRLGGSGQEERPEVLKAGGLSVLGCGRAESLRIDCQLQGRAGRQGDPGESRFFVSSEDPLFSGETLAFPFSAEQVRRLQHRVECRNADQRAILAKYSFLTDQQRRIIEHKRLEALLHSEGGIAYRLSEQGIARRLYLKAVNLRWPQYLESMEAVRDGIHLTLIGGRSPIDEYHKLAIKAFAEMEEDIRKDVSRGLRLYAREPLRLERELREAERRNDITGNGSICLTYQINENKSQFTRLPDFLREWIFGGNKGTI